MSNFSKILAFLKPRLSWKYALVVLVILGAGGFLTKQYVFPSKDGLETATIGRGEVEEVYVLSGIVRADEYAALAFPTAGKLSYVGVAPGDQVKKGQYLAKLDTTTLNSTFESAKSDLRIAEAELQRVHDDVKNHASDETYTQKDTRTTAEAGKDKAYEDYKVAEYNLKNATLVAPFAGLVTTVTNPFAGINISALQTQIEVINPSTTYFEVLADQTEVTTIKLGQTLRVELDAFSSKSIDGTVEHVSYVPKAGEVGTVYAIRIGFSEAQKNDLNFRVGMSGDAVFTLDSKDNVLWAPADFIKSDDKGDYLLTGRNGRTKLYVEVGLEGDDRVEVKGEGVSEGLTIYD